LDLTPRTTNGGELSGRRWGELRGRQRGQLPAAYGEIKETVDTGLFRPDLLIEVEAVAAIADR
ncbi:hypothetical protein, partial [Micromonospora globbae]|uniref:hypothetical protein n=1 Tax=Micromonospora globbae TaxID=1894969 RepID=UPI00195B0B90